MIAQTWTSATVCGQSILSKAVEDCAMAVHMSPSPARITGSKGFSKKHKEGGLIQPTLSPMTGLSVSYNGKGGLLALDILFACGVLGLESYLH